MTVDDRKTNSREIIMVIHVSRGEERLGPYPLNDVNDYLKRGLLSPSDLAWHKGAGSWMPLSAVPGVTTPPPSPPVPSPPVPSPPVPSPPVPSPSRPVRKTEKYVPGRLNFIHAFTFPFRQASWPLKVWWLPLVNFVPIFNLIAMRGWRLDIIRGIGKRGVEDLPSGKDLGRFLADGITLWFMTFLYNLPLLVMLVMSGATMIGDTLAVTLWAIRALFDGSISLVAVLTDWTIAVLSKMYLPFLYLLLLWPVHRAAVLRFAMTGRASSFFKVFSNLRLVLNHLPDFMLLFFFDVMMTRIGLGIINGLLLGLGIGVALVPAVTIPLYYWTTGHLYGQVAAKVWLDAVP